MQLGTSISCEQCAGSHYLVWPPRAGVDGAAVGRGVQYICPRTSDPAVYVLRQRAIALQERPPGAIDAQIVR